MIELLYVNSRTMVGPDSYLVAHRKFGNWNPEFPFVRKLSRDKRAISMPALGLKMQV